VTQSGYRDVIVFSIGLEALLFIGIGVYALVRRRPFVVRSAWMLILLLIIFGPMMFMQVALWLETRRNPYGHSPGLWGLLGPLSLLIFAAFMVKASRGYLVFSATQSSFREALLAALAGLSLPFEERLGAVMLPSVPAEIQVAVQGWIGTGQLRLRNGGSPELMAQIASAMNTTFESANAQTNMTWATLNVVLGLLMGAMTIGLVAA